MTSHGESAVVVLAAGSGTRMRSDTPKVLHQLGGRSMIAHVLHAVAKVAPQHLVVVLGNQRDQVAPEVAALAAALGRPIEVAVQQEQLGTGDAVLCGLAGSMGMLVGARALQGVGGAMMSPNLVWLANS